MGEGWGKEGFALSSLTCLNGEGQQSSRRAQSQSSSVEVSIEQCKNSASQEMPNNCSPDATTFETFLEGGATLDGEGESDI